jgi:plasmid stabilization system protein ParE
LKLFIQVSAEADLLRQFEWYVEQGLPNIALQYRRAVREAINALVSMPGAGVPRHIANS